MCSALFNGPARLWHAGKRILTRATARVAAGLAPPVPYQPLFVTLEMVCLARAYYVVAELGIADLLRNGPKTCGELAAAVGGDEPTLFRILRTLAAFDVFADDGRGRFALRPHGWSLLSDAPVSDRHWTMLAGSNAFWQAYGQALEMAKTGRPAFELAHGQPVYRHFLEHALLHETFRKGMSGWTDWQCREVVRRYDFRRFGTVVDVGGGIGSLILEILRRCPKTRGVLYDQPETAERARPRVAQEGFADRCDVIGGSFLESVPADADAYVLKHVLRDWSDADAVTILRRCHAAMPPHATLLVVDALLDPRNGRDRLVKLIDLEQMFICGGGVRTPAEYDRLFAESGFRRRRTLHTRVVDAAILEAGKA